MAVILYGCTVTPVSVKPREISFDGNERNAGLLAYTLDGSAVITSNALARYNGLILRYGTNFIPALTVNEGITSTTSNVFLIDAQHLIKFGTMNYWRRNGLR